jgi:uncharacterized protein YggE
LNFERGSGTGTGPFAVQRDMRRSLVTATVLLSAPIVLAACGSTPHSAPTRQGQVLTAASTPAGGAATITTQGVGTVLGAPDTVRIAIGVNTTAAHAADALAHNNSIAAAVQAALQKDGVAAKDIQTSGLSLQQNWSGSVPNGYSVEDDVTAVLRDLNRAGTIVDDALAPAGDSGRLQYVNLWLSDSNPLMAAARQQAVTSAKVQAQQMAAAAGLRLGQLVSLTDQPQESPMPVYGVAASAGASASMPPVPIQPGTQQLSVTVTAVWQTSGS